MNVVLSASFTVIWGDNLLMPGAFRSRGAEYRTTRVSAVRGHIHSFPTHWTVLCGFLLLGAAGGKK